MPDTEHPFPLCLSAPAPLSLPGTVNPLHPAIHTETYVVITHWHTQLTSPEDQGTVTPDTTHQKSQDSVVVEPEAPQKLPGNTLPGNLELPPLCSIPCRMMRSLWSRRRYFSSDVSATVPIRALRDDTQEPRPSEPSDPESKGSASNGWIFRRLGFFTGELKRKQHIWGLCIISTS